ncbi:MAG: hypothetical protein K2X81_01105 [Candidatus Obscuribacterales bacterium]|nr:hypothetical protein [Candidatus Obscuribacterales bacterium]
MKNLIPLMALLVVGGSFAGPAMAGEHCKKGAKGGDDCCKDGDKHKSHKSKASAEKGAAAADKGDAETKPAESK